MPLQKHGCTWILLLPSTMIPHQIMLLLALLLITSFDMSIAKGKFKKTKNAKLTFPTPPGDKRGPLVSLREYSVEIANELRTFVLNTHCQSKDDDLGLHKLQPNEQQDWSFRGNVLGTTRFFCRLEWRYGYLTFDVFYNNEEFLTNYCGESVCSWSARQDGVYVMNNDGQFVFRDYWEMLA